MANDPRPDDRPDGIADVSFRHSLRGYDPAEVDAYLAQVAERLAQLERQHQAAAARLQELGERDPAEQIDALTADINTILHAARTAAENLRGRSEVEAQTMAAHVERATREGLASAESDAYALRQDAWEAGTKLLGDVQKYVAATKAEADKSALAIVGEAERSAHRKLAAARRDADSQIRAARIEGERIRIEAQGERDELLENARRTTEAAQERTRALERRRDELLADIDRIQTSEAAPSAPARSASTTVRVFDPANPPSEPDDDGIRIIRPESGTQFAEGMENVRVVKPPPKEPVELLDANSIADEVRRLREPEESEELTEPADTPEEAAAEPPQPTEAPVEPVVPAVDEPAEESALEAPAAAEHTEESSVAEEADMPPVEIHDSDGNDEVAVTLLPPEEPEDEPEPEPVAGTEIPENGEVASEEQPAEEHPGEEQTEATGGPDPETTAEIENLFDLLRHAEDAEPDASGRVEAPGSDVEPEPAGASSQIQVVLPPPGAIDPATVGTEISVDTPIEDLVAAPAADPFELRDQLLLPITNRVLRAVKRQLSDVQNIALEGLRNDPDGWMPDPGEIERQLSPHVMVLLQEASAAGANATGELTGSSVTRPKPSGTDGASAALAEAIATGLRHAVVAGRDAGQGARELSSGVSKVFRAWRTDESERRLRALAIGAYHEGMRDACTQIGGHALRLVVSGAGCEDCRAAADGPIEPTSAVPPLHDECGCTLVPA